MAAVDRVKTRTELEGVNNALFDIFREALREEMWAWFDENAEQELLSVRKLWVFSFTVRVKHLRPLFVMLFGPRPSASDPSVPFTG